MSDSIPALHRAEGHGKLGELVHRLVERAGARGALTETEFNAELPAGIAAHLRDEIRARLALLGVAVVEARDSDGVDSAASGDGNEPAAAPADGRPVGAAASPDGDG